MTQRDTKKLSTLVRGLGPTTYSGLDDIRGNEVEYFGRDPSPAMHHSLDIRRGRTTQIQL